MRLIKWNSIWLVMCFLLNTSAMALENQSPADTLGTDTDISETVVVSAPRVTVEEVIASITQRVQRDDYLMDSYEYTTLITQVLRDSPGFQGDTYKIEEFAFRNHFSRESGEQAAKLWERSRRFENGEQVEDEIDEEISAEYLTMQDGMIEEMPFSSTGGHLYHYNILDRKLVGNNLIYKISFRPKVKFDALPSGTIWVDYSNWVVRKFEARMTDTVPYPMFLKSVPVYRMSQERFGEFWFPTEIYLQIILRHIPLLPIPNTIEVRVSLRDIVINGKSFGPEDTAPGTGESGVTAEEIASGFWLTEEASNDSLATYWNEMGDQWEAELSPQTIPITLSFDRADSLSEVGTTRLQDLRDGNLWRVKPEYVKTPGYNRVQGVVASVGLTIEKQGPANPSLQLAAGYAFANKRPVFDGALNVPLLRSRWSLNNAPTDGRAYLGATYEVLALHFAGRKGSGLFGGDSRRHTRSATAFFYGSDPNHYFEERGLNGHLTWRLSKDLVVYAGGGYVQHRPWSTESGWNLLGRSLRPQENMAALHLDDSYGEAGADWSWRALELAGRVTWHDLGDAPNASPLEFNISGELDLLGLFGNQWLLKASHRSFDNTAPLQWKSWMGDYGPLRGYNAGELTGDAGIHGSLDTRFGLDLFQMARVPLLKNWRLQPIGFVDWGKTWDTGSGPVDPAEGARGWRMDVGFGFGKRFDLPGLGEFKNIRLYAAHPVGDGSDGHGWRFLLGFEK